MAERQYIGQCGCLAGDRPIADPQHQIVIPKIPPGVILEQPEHCWVYPQNNNNNNKRIKGNVGEECFLEYNILFAKFILQSINASLFVFTVIRTESRALYTQSKCSTTKLRKANALPLSYTHSPTGAVSKENKCLFY